MDWTQLLKDARLANLTDPRGWPMQGSIVDVEWTQHGLCMRYTGTNAWQSKKQQSGRFIYGNFVAVVMIQGEPVMGTFEWAADGPDGTLQECKGQAGDTVDAVNFVPRFEESGQPSKVMQPGEELLLAVAAPCRYHTTPAKHGLTPVRTSWAIVKWGQNGVLGQVDETGGAPETVPAHGPMLDLMAFRRRDSLRLAGEFIDLGATAIGFGALPLGTNWTIPEARNNPVPFQGHDVDRLKPWYRKTMDDVVDALVAAGARPVIYGMGFPIVRRGFVPDIHRGGTTFTNLDWSLWRPDGELVKWYQEFWRDQVVEPYADVADFVDGVEPFTNQMAQPPNRFTESVQAVTPGVMRAGVDELHYDPGVEPIFGSERARVFDGWGQGTDRRWKFTDADGNRVRLNLAGLSGAGNDRDSEGRLVLNQVEAEKKEATYFAQRFRESAAQGVEFFLYLYTLPWPVGTHADAVNQNTRPGLFWSDDGPFTRIQKRLSNVADRLRERLNGDDGGDDDDDGHTDDCE